MTSGIGDDYTFAANIIGWDMQESKFGKESDIKNVFQKAINKGDIDSISALLSEGNSIPKGAFVFVVGLRDIAFARVFLKHGAQVTQAELECALIRRDHRMLDLLLKYIETNSPEWVLFFERLQCFMPLEVIEVLKKHDVGVNSTDKQHVEFVSIDLPPLYKIRDVIKKEDDGILYTYVKAICDGVCHSKIQNNDMYSYILQKATIWDANLNRLAFLYKNNEAGLSAESRNKIAMRLFELMRELELSFSIVKNQERLAGVIAAKFGRTIPVHPDEELEEMVEKGDLLDVILTMTFSMERFDAKYEHPMTNLYAANFLNLCIMYGNIGVFNYLSKYTELNEEHLYFAVRTGQIEFVKLIIATKQFDKDAIDKAKIFGKQGDFTEILQCLENPMEIDIDDKKSVSGKSIKEMAFYERLEYVWDYHIASTTYQNDFNVVSLKRTIHRFYDVCAAIELEEARRVKRCIIGLMYLTFCDELDKPLALLLDSKSNTLSQKRSHYIVYAMNKVTDLRIMKEYSDVPADVLNEICANIPNIVDGHIVDGRLLFYTKILCCFLKKIPQEMLACIKKANSEIVTNAIAEMFPELPALLCSEMTTDIANLSSASHIAFAGNISASSISGGLSVYQHVVGQSAANERST